MSYDISMRLHAQSSSAHWNALEDDLRGKFLKQLDAAEIECSEWEANFIESFLSAGIPSSWWTAARRTSCDEMRKKYEGRL